MPNTPIVVVTAAEARERDAQAIAGGISSRELMHNAGVAAASSIMALLEEVGGGAVEIHTGPGNNGGDGWVVAGELARNGIPVHVIEAEPARTPDALDAKASANREKLQALPDSPSIVVDALLGTGSHGPLSGKILQSVQEINSARKKGVKVVALDIPTGLDATTGQHGECVQADTTLTFGTLKRGHLVARGVCGNIDVIDIGLGKSGLPHAGDIVLASPDWISARIPPIAADAHKGTRKRLAIIAGDEGMAGAAILAGKAALRSGIGLVHLIVAAENRDAIHCAIPAAIVSTHDELEQDARKVLKDATAFVAGPGLYPENAKRLLSVIAESGIPAVLDAGALSAFEQDMDALGKFCSARQVVLTPHPAEMARLLGSTTDDVLARRFEIASELAEKIGATVLLKGTPTIVSNAAGETMVTATGTPALATGGSGDLLSGIIGTLLSQTGNSFESAVCSAWIHGRAAELCGSPRGVTLEDILFAMPAAWNVPSSQPNAPVLASLPAVR